MMNSLFDILGGEVQVSIAHPLNLEPIPEVVVSTTTKLHLQMINGLFLETASWHVCVLVEANSISQAHLTAKRVRGRRSREKKGELTALFLFLFSF